MTTIIYSKMKFSITYDTFFVLHRLLLNISNSEEKSACEENVLSLLKHHDTISMAFCASEDFQFLQEALSSFVNFAYKSVDEFVPTMNRARDSKLEVSKILDVILNTEKSIYPQEIEFCAVT